MEVCLYKEMTPGRVKLDHQWRFQGLTDVNKIHREISIRVFSMSHLTPKMYRIFREEVNYSSSRSPFIAYNTNLFQFQDLTLFSIQTTVRISYLLVKKLPSSGPFF